MKPNKFSSGHDQARIPDLSWVDADWGKGDNCANRLRMMNGAFETYFFLLSSIAECEDAGHRGVMTAELVDAAETGWRLSLLPGVTDLDDAFNHWLQPGHWTDTNVGDYMKVNGSFGGQNPAMVGLSAACCWGLQTNIMPNAPLAAVNFFKALDDKMAILKGAIADHNEQVPQLVTAVTNKDESRVDKIFHTIADKAKIAKKFLWLAPTPDDSTAALALKGGATFIKSIADIDTFLSVHQQALQTGIFDNKTSTVFAALTLALGKVPVLGSFYKQIGKNIPGLIAGINAEFEDYYRRIDRMTQVY